MIKIISIILLVFFTSIAQEVLDISVKGISDSKNEGAQKDRMEAMMDAKRQACEKAGLHLKSKTTVENFQTTFDYIESEAEAILLPGFQVIDIGYVADGTYQLVLTGKIKTVIEEKISAKELRYAKSLYDRGKYGECRQILEKYINNKENDASEALQEEALYLNIKWGYSFNPQEDCEKYAAYYPDNPKAVKLLEYGKFASKPIINYSEEFAINDDKWIEGDYNVDKNTFISKNIVLSDTLILSDFLENKITFLLQCILYKENKTNKEKNSAYKVVMQYWKGNKQNPAKEKIYQIDEHIKLFSNKGSKTFQFSSSGKWFNNFKLKYFQMKGMIPTVEDKFKYNIKFDIFANGF